MDKQELQTLIQGSGLSTFMQRTGIEKMSIEFGGKDTDINIQIFRKRGSKTIHGEAFAMTGQGSKSKPTPKIMF